ncbi:carboxylate-amine ligase [Noviherbaspirillum saxi]|uniref:Glutamate--cysteine ligase n=1 Tax=Noviherbaspirillum saxi TaxID=2320863 RepID=A0A3A3FWR7_9BURK|nr:glutamate-cysteine ligase family protein [Noviherbaspirillum saxi]RJF99088.1 glutamate--cysteine ligase [Noviherbaspirillum saxi]
MSDEEDEPPLLHAFMGYGIELEYMIVDRARLSVLPLADVLLRESPGGEGNEVRRGRMGWSNELVMHVIEIKNLRPSVSLSMLPDVFQAEVREINRLLEPRGARLMPGAMHPWMDPRSETQLWPHDNEDIYRAYDRIFDSKSHGWANLQSMHVNLPFAGDDEFARLHAAVRLVLPILPALAASSPIADGKPTGFADYRMHVYSSNADAIPSIAGMIVPETVTSKRAYEQRILAPMYKDIAPYDTDGVLKHEWLNSRGAIARFERNAIEIRVLDTQECPRADLAIAAVTVDAIRRLYRAGGPDLAEQQEMSTAALAAILQACIRDAEQTVIDNPAYLRLFAYPGHRCTTGELWDHLVGLMLAEDVSHAELSRVPLQAILQHGPLARRIVRALGTGAARKARAIRDVYEQLCDCLQEGKMFLP